MAAAEPAHPALPEPEPRRPPVTLLSALSIAFVAAGVSTMAAYLPHRAPMAVAVTLLVLSAGVLVVNAVLVAAQKELARWRLLQVAAWGLLAYIVIAGMIEYAFIYDHTRGTTLAVLTLFLVVFTLNVPLILGFTVARYERDLRREASADA